MTGPALDGFLLGTGLIVAIGAQNAFVLRMGLLRRHVFVLCLVCALSDAVLIGVGVAGVGAVVAAAPSALKAVTLAGAAFLAFYAIAALARALRPEALAPAADGAHSLTAAVSACLAFTFLNPHVYLDTVVLIGGLSGRYPGAMRLAFAGGAIAASFAWFFGLGYGARLLAPVFTDRRAWRGLDLAIAAVMAWLAWKLVAPLVVPA